MLRLKTALAAMAVLAAPLTATVALTPASADAAAAGGKYYANCDALHRDYRYGVANSARSAAAQVRAGYGRPSTSKTAKAVYQTNRSRLDRDKDGTACETS
ncbi:excalibur calcium-binding domain-containing protein [Nocardioides sp. GXZ039]|uniref:excalibur calcium-binding domain-containing protein n=1 Tax=Nocardioides sp. GXZ039 TaxID=3136018 RepID=UPI0030F463B5